MQGSGRLGGGGCDRLEDESELVEQMAEDRGDRQAPPVIGRAARCWAEAGGGPTQEQAEVEEAGVALRRRAAGLLGRKGKRRRPERRTG